jgi:hypothetical protein
MTPYDALKLTNNPGAIRGTNVSSRGRSWSWPARVKSFTVRHPAVEAV